MAELSSSTNYVQELPKEVNSQVTLCLVKLVSHKINLESTEQIKLTM